MTQELLNYFKGDELAAQAWENKYALTGEVTPNDMHVRLAEAYAKVEAKFIEKDEDLSKKIPLLSDYGQMRFGELNIWKNTENLHLPLTIRDSIIYPLFERFKYIIPGGSIMANLGKEAPTSLSNCFVLGQPEDSIESIFDFARDAAQLYKRRGGVGIDISYLRPKQAEVNNASKTSTGSVSFMDLYSEVTKLIGQEGRRGALMLSIDVNHPDVMDFITIKQDLTRVTGANVSVKTNAEFMKAVENDEDYLLTFPTDWKPASQSNEFFTPNTDKLMTDGHGHYWRKIKAKVIWNKLIECAHKSAEPGILFWDKHLDQDPTAVYPEYTPVSTNPCGEIPLQPKDSCRLSAVNLYSLVKNPFKKDAYLDLEKAYSVFYEQLILSDNLVELELQSINRILDKIEDVNSTEYRLWSEVLETGRNSRRVGNGFTGLADMFAALGTNYGSITSKGGFGDLMLIKLKAEIDATTDLAILRGTFHNYKSTAEYGRDKEGIIYGKNSFYQHILNVYPEGVKKMNRFGRRNVSWSTVAPTGTVSLMAQVSSGIEPVFSPYYIRRMKVANKEEATFIDVDGQAFKEFVVVHPKLQEFASIAYSLDLTINHSESVWKEIYEASPYYQSCSADLRWEDRLSIQQIAQLKTTHSISSTLNLASTVTKEEVDNIYRTAYNIGLKGITIYRDGSRGGILVNTSTKEDSDKFVTHRAPKRPKALKADIHTLTNKGVKYAVIVGLYESKPYEVFVYDIPKDLEIKCKQGELIKVSKGHYKFVGADYTCENVHAANDDNMEKKATALYVSMLLRTGADLKFIIKTAKKVDDNISSFTSAMCRVLSKYVEKEIIEGEVCPECGGKIIHEAGCEKCVDCSYSKCLMIHKFVN